MNSPEFQLVPIDWLVVGFRGVPLELVAALNLCRHFDGTVLYREKDVMVIEIGSDPETIDELLARLPKGAVTHLWRSRPQPRAPTGPTHSPAQFLRHIAMLQNVRSNSVCAAAGGLAPGSGSPAGSAVPPS